jgi:soluble lytic murein transglycosylase
MTALREERPADSTVIAADEALERGQPWHASRLLVEVLEDSTRRTPEAVLLAATAASRWGGWNEVERLLAPVEWKDTLFDGRAHLLLGRAALERGEGAAAETHARAALEQADGDFAQGERLVLLARALERLARPDSAARSYARAAGLLPDAADWLRLRAAALSSDAAERRALFAAVGAAEPRSRIARIEATALERAGDTLAIGAWGAIGDSVGVLRLELARADAAQRAALRSRLMDLVAARAGTAEGRRAVALLDSAFAPLSPAEELVVARAAGRGGPLARAARAYARALDGGIASADDRYAYADILFRLARYPEAAAQYDRIPADHPRAGAAAYAAARALVRAGRVTDGIAALERIGQRFAGDTAGAGSALFLRADLAVDAHADSAARALFLELAARYPTSRHAAGARFRAALIAYAAGDAATAAAELDTLLARYPRAEDALAARYWRGRLSATLGDTAAAASAWRAVMRAEPASYYAAASARRLGVEPWRPAAAPDSFVAVPALDTVLARAALLERLGLAAESEWEIDALVAAALRDDARGPEAVERLLSVADALRARDRSSESIRIARRAEDRGAPRDARLYRLLYPVVRPERLLHEADRQQLDPAFVAALIRQESMFNPQATSPVGARGLMQLMPEVGRSIATAVGFPVWDPVLLYQPDVNLQLGTQHLRDLARRYDRPVDILAAYNAGASRVERWSERPGAADPELFAERIPYVETRDYVRIIQRNRELYRALYDWPAEPPTRVVTTGTPRGLTSAGGAR